MGENSKTVNLWGETVYLEKRTKGRPPFEWTEENSKKISMLLAMGWTNTRIASCVLDPRTGKPISVPTLKRYFRAELQLREVARDQFNARRLMVTVGEAFKGSMQAMRLLSMLVKENDAVVAEATVIDEPLKPKAPPIGKKEANAAAALEADADLMAELEAEAAKLARH